MKKISVLLMLITAFYLYFQVIYPYNLGERTPVWELKERYFGEDYIEKRTEYFISLNKRKFWYDYDTFFVWSDHDVFRTTKVYLEISEEVAKNCKLHTSGMIEWQSPHEHLYIHANVFTNDPLLVWFQGDEYSLDETEESIRKFETATGKNAKELLDTVHFIREEFRAALSQISETEYQNICSKIQQAIIWCAIVWGVFIFVCIVVQISKKSCEKRLDRDMEKYIG